MCGTRIRLLALASGLQGLAASAVLFYSTADPTYNTNAPTGALAASGWQYEGTWGSFLGTPIGPHCFITARHIGGGIGDPFVFNGTPYATTAMFDDPSSDLRIWRVCETFPVFAPLYTKTNELGQGLVVFGRGTQRGVPVSVTPGRTNGWQWGEADGVERWGQNVVSEIVDGDQLVPSAGGQLGSLLRASFDANAGANEATLSVGDSGGAVFLNDPDDGIWKLAGINYGVDGEYNTSTNGPGFEAAIFDERGLYMGEEGAWTLVPNGPVAVPGGFYATRVSAHLDWINSILALPDPLPVLQAAESVSGPFADVPGAAVDGQAGTITIGVPSGSQFYRLRACVTLVIDQVRVAGGQLILTYRVPVP